MKASEVIQKLALSIDLHGDMPVMITIEGIEQEVMIVAAYNEHGNYGTEENPATYVAIN